MPLQRYSRRDGSAGATYSFKHALVQDAAYQSLLKTRRQELHARMARILEEQYPELVDAEPYLLAHHLTEAGMAENAIGQWRRAGKQAAMRSANVKAIGHLRRGLELVESLPPSPDLARQEIDLRIAMGDALATIKGFAAPEIGEVYAQARRLCDRIDDPSRLSMTLQGSWFFHVVRSDLHRALDLAEQCLVLAGRSRAPITRAVGHHMMAGPLAWLGRWQEAERHFRRGIELAASEENGIVMSINGLDLEMWCRSVGSHSLWHLGFPAQAVERAMMALERAQARRQPFGESIARAYLAMLHQFRREPAAAGEQAAAGIALCAEQGFPYYLAWMQVIQGWSLAADGSPGEGVARIRQALAAMEATGARLRRPYYFCLLAETCALFERVEEADALLAEALSLADAWDERWWEPEIHRLRGDLLRRRGSTVEAGAAFSRALELARGQDARVHELRAARDLAHLWGEQGRRAEAHDLLAPLYASFTEEFDTADLQNAKILLDELA